MENELKPCPWCGAKPKVIEYPTLIQIHCVQCANAGRKVMVSGDGSFSGWARQQANDGSGYITLSAETNPMADTEAFNRLAALWNTRPDTDKKGVSNG